MNNLQKLHEVGQSPWLDFIRRDYIEDGRLAEWRDKGVRGVTSNPAIFEQAIAGSNLYDQDIERMAAEGLDAFQIYDELSVRDVQEAADIFRPIYDESEGRDGYVSLEVSPLLARDTNGTIADAHRLWRKVNRPNVMIKIPATLAGVPAIEQCLIDGIPINVTLLFGIKRYVAVMEAYIRAITQRAEVGKAPGLASVASFFVSRVDSKVDPIVSERGRRHLQGKLAIANAQAAYEACREMFCTEEFTALREQGAWVQRVLWASTSTKNPDYSPVMYVDNLIGPNSVNTMPLNTLEATLERSIVQDRLTDGTSHERVIAEAAEIGIDLEQVADELEAEAIQKFVDPFQALMSSIENKRQAAV